MPKEIVGCKTKVKAKALKLDIIHKPSTHVTLHEVLRKTKRLFKAYQMKEIY